MIRSASSPLYTAVDNRFRAVRNTRFDSIVQCEFHSPRVYADVHLRLLCIAEGLGLVKSNTFGKIGKGERQGTARRISCDANEDEGTCKLAKSTRQNMNRHKARVAGDALQTRDADVDLRWPRTVEPRAHLDKTHPTRDRRDDGGRVLTQCSDKEQQVQGGRNSRGNE